MPADIASAPKFYWFTLIVFALALFVIWRLTQSPFGAALQGARDQPRRMRMLGHNVWLIQWFAFVLASFWGSVAGLLYVALVISRVVGLTISRQGANESESARSKVVSARR